MVVEAIAGFWTGSLALLSDAAHMFSDAASLALALLAVRLAQRPADARRSYGHGRYEVLAAFVNGLTLVLLGVWIVIEAVQRLFAPVAVMGAPMLVVAVLGAVVNLAMYFYLHREGGNLNVQGAAAHVLSDLLGSVAAIAAAIVILTSGWTMADPLLSMLVALLTIRIGWKVTRSSAHVLLEGHPPDLDLPALERGLSAAVPALAEIHHVHAWAITPERPQLTFHARLVPGADGGAALVAIQRFLGEHYPRVHATVQVEPAGDDAGCGAGQGCA